MKLFIANFGIGNSLWPSCLASSTLATFEFEDTWPLWLAGDREGYIARCVETKKSVAGIRPTRQVASRWFNIGTILSSTEGDIWIHREKGDLWWAISQPGEIEASLEPSFVPVQTGDRIYILRKRVDAWSNKSRMGNRLEWPGLHAKAREFLFTEGTLQSPSSDNALYAQALIEGGDLSRWHSRPDWRAKAAKAGKGPTVSFNAKERSIMDMAMTARETVAGSNGQQVLRTVKNKDVRFETTQKFEAYIKALIELQEGLCAITGLRLQFNGDHEDTELLCSLDRIDSDGHYEIGNLQVVCRFINRWKSNENDAQFRRLVGLVRGTDDLV